MFRANNLRKSIIDRTVATAVDDANRQIWAANHPKVENYALARGAVSNRNALMH